VRAPSAPISGISARIQSKPHKFKFFLHPALTSFPAAW
jgi:hypothetical protein